MEDLQQLGRRFSHALSRAKELADDQKKQMSHTEKVHIVGAGRIVTAAYEQLRNAAEYADEHLLLQKAVRRFYKRTFLAQSADFISTSADELITELTLAGYIANDTVTEQMISTLNKLVTSHHRGYLHIQSACDMSNVLADKWVVDVLSVEVAHVLTRSYTKEAFAQFAFDYFKDSLNIERIFPGGAPSDFEPALFVAVERALLKSDPAIIRASLLRRYSSTVDNFTAYSHVNTEIDTLFESNTVELLTRVVDRQGAPMRIIARMLEEKLPVSELLHRKKRFLGAFEGQVENEYQSINQRINKGIVKSVAFLVITKFLVGIAVEVPFDYLVHGYILWLPLLINLFFPPIYMVLLRFTLTLPPRANTDRLLAQAETILFKPAARQLSRPSKNSFGAVYNFVYALFFLLVFGGVSWLLVMYAQFGFVHLVIFFTFLSGASFLGFRLSRMIREIEAVDSQQNTMTVLRDFLYMPFVVVGRWMSEKYSKVNFVSMILDMVIELPLKTVLRLIRQWSAFISSKKDQL